MKVKYVERRVRQDGKVLWVVNPAQHLKDAVEAKYDQFDLLDEANQYAQEILDAYADYKKGIKREVRAAMASVDGLFEYYRSTKDYKELKPNSKRMYHTMIQQASMLHVGRSNMRFGEIKATSIGPEFADKLYDHVKEVKSLHRATTMCKVLRKVWFVGLRAGRVKSNPFQKMGLKKLDDRTVLWEPEQVQAFIAKADELNMKSIGTMAMLCYDLCQRPGDMRQITWGNYKNGVFTFKQEKTRTEMQIPASPRLRERLQAVKPTGASEDTYIVLCEATGKPYDRRLYSKWAAKVRLEAGLPSSLQIRDLRRTGATEMAEAGCTEDELRSVTGHQSRDVLSIYVRPTTKLAASGINRRFAN